MAGPDYKVGRFSLQPYRQLLESGRPVQIKPKALAVLSVLAEANGALVTKDELMAAIWPNVIVEENALQAHVAALRKSLGRDAGLLVTVHGSGYRLTPTPEAPTVPPPGARGRRLESLALLCVVATVLAAGGLYVASNRMAAPHAKRPAQIALLPFDVSTAGPDTGRLASDLSDAISADLSSARILVASSGSTGKPAPPNSDWPAG